MELINQQKDITHRRENGGNSVNITSRKLTNKSRINLGDAKNSLPPRNSWSYDEDIPRKKSNARKCLFVIN